MIIIAPGTGNNLANTGLTSNGGVSASSRGTSALPSSQTTLSLTPDDAQAVAKIPDVTEVSPILSIQMQAIARQPQLEYTRYRSGSKPDGYSKLDDCAGKLAQYQ